jgi:aerobic carbon-monoxide dehydrogenase medium subunit
VARSVHFYDRRQIAQKRVTEGAVKPAKFEYHAPATPEDAIALLVQYQGEARLLAGGQSLIPMLNFRLVAPAAIVDLNRIEPLSYIESEDGMVRLGAMTRHRAIEFSPVVARQLPLLAEAIRLVAHLPIRTRGTIGGSLAHADPAAELPMVLLALDGEVVAKGPAGERVVAASDLFRGLLETSLADDEMITEIRFHTMPPGAGCAVEEFARRRGDFAIAAVAAVVEAEGEHCTTARLAAAGVGPAASRLEAAEAILEQQGLGDAAIEAAAAKAAELVSPLSDLHASADYRRHLVRVLTARALRRARAPR